MATNNEADTLQQSHYSQLEDSQKPEYEHYFKQVSHQARPENKTLTKNLAAYFTASPDRFLGEFEAKEYTLSRTYIESNAQVRLYYSKFVNKTKSTATLCIVHGFGEHSGRWIDVADHFVRQGFEVHIADLRGFGHSGGPRFNATIDQLHRDIEVLLGKSSKNLPLFVMGHSMGGALVSSLLIRNPNLNIAGVILSSPMFELSPERPVDLKKKVIVKAVGDDLEDIMLNAMVNPTSLTKNNTEVKRAIDDRLMTPLLSMRLAKTLILLLENTVPFAKNFSYPFLAFHGKRDTLTSHRATEEFHKQAGSKDKKIKLFENGYHELWNDVEREEALKLVTDWIDEKAKTAKPFGNGFLFPLKKGIEKKPASNTLKKKAAIAVLVVVYLILLRRLRSNPFLKTNLRWILFPLSFLLRTLRILN